MAGAAKLAQVKGKGAARGIDSPQGQGGEMRTIYKYPIEITDRQKLSVHHKSRTRIIHAGLDPSGQPCVWVEVDSDGELQECFTVYVVGTGGPVPAGACHVGSFVHGPFVWHVYV